MELGYPFLIYARMRRELMRQYLTFSALLAAIFMVNFELTGAFVILNSIQHSLQLDMNQLAWLIMLYQIFFASVLILGGRIGDLFGHRNTAVFGLALFILASIIGASASGLSLLCFARVLQGISAALAWPNLMALAFANISKTYRGLALGCVSAVIGLGLALGPLCSGYLVSEFGWQSFFLLNVPILLIAILGLVLGYANTRSTKMSALDIRGSVVLMLLLISLVLFVDQLTSTALMHRYAYWLIGMAILLLFGFFIIERRAKQPILPIALVRNYAFLLVCLQRLITVFPLYVILFAFSLYLHHQRHTDITQVGVFFLPMTLTIAFLSPLSGRLVDIVGGKNGLLLSSVLYLQEFRTLVF